MHEVKMSQNNQIHKDYHGTGIGDRLNRTFSQSIYNLDIVAAPIECSARNGLI